MLNSVGNNNKPPKISAKDRNNLINKLSSTATLNEQPQKELKNMNEDEKKIYREELRKKLKNKQNEKKMLRTNNFNKNNFNKNNKSSETMDKLADLMKNIPHNLSNNTTDNIKEDNIKEDNTKEDNTKENNTTGNISNLNDILKTVNQINDLVNQNYKDNNNDSEDNFEDYIK